MEVRSVQAKRCLDNPRKFSLAFLQKYFAFFEDTGRTGTDPFPDRFVFKQSGSAWALLFLTTKFTES